MLAKIEKYSCLQKNNECSTLFCCLHVHTGDDIQVVDILVYCMLRAMFDKADIQICSRFISQVGVIVLIGLYMVLGAFIFEVKRSSHLNISQFFSCFWSENINASSFCSILGNWSRWSTWFGWKSWSGKNFIQKSQRCDSGLSIYYVIREWR